MIALITDTHFGQKSFSKTIFETQMEFFEQEFFPYILKNKIKNVFHLGDIVHNRNTIDLWILQELKTRFFKWFDDNNVKLHLLIGNHDLYYRSTLDYSFQKENLNEFKNCIIYDKETIIEIDRYTIAMEPWICDTETFILPKNVDILFGHLEMRSFPMMKNILSHDGYEYDMFKDYKYVFSGHYHTKSNKENIYYIGTQYQLTWNDYNEDKGFYVLKDDYKLEFIKNNISPKFVKIFYNNGDLKQTGLATKENITEKEAIEITKNNYIKIFITACNDQYKFDNFHSSLNLISKNDYKIEIINLEDVIEDYDFSHIEENEEENTIDIIITYINNMTFEESVNRDTLIEMSKILYREANDEALSVGDD